MKDTAISYDLVHHQHHHQQPQAQQHSWNHQRQPQLQTHTTSIYSNHHQHLHQTSQQPNSHSRQSQQQQQQQQQQAQPHDAQLGQYSHQQLQSAVAAAAQHNNVAAYYQQQAAHLYPTYHAQQDQQQHHNIQDHHAHHHHGAAVTASNSVATASALNAAVVAAAQQHAAAAAGGAQNSALNHHTGWSQAGIGPMAAAAAAAHHAVVTDHSTLAYMTHAYQNHDSSAVTDHHRSTVAPLANQPIGSAAQASTYTVDTLYSTPAAAAAVAAAYGYNNYNAAFFQTSNNGPHTQAGHPPPADLSSFWGQTTQQQQPRTSHSQTVSSQAASLQQQQQRQQQQQQLTPEQQANNYLHDHRLYAYNRSPYGQNATHNFGLQQQAELQQQPQAAPQQHHRMSANLSQHSLMQHHQQDHTQQQQHQSLSHQLSQQTSLSSQRSNQLASSPQLGQQQTESESRKSQSALRASPQLQQQQQQSQKPPSDNESMKSKLDFDDRTTNQLPSSQQKTTTSSLQQQQHSLSGDEVDSKSSLQTAGNDHHQQQSLSINSSPSTKSISSISKSQSVIKAEPQTNQYQSRVIGVNSRPQANVTQAAPGTRNIYRVPQEDRIRSQNVDTQSKKFTSDPRDTSRATAAEPTVTKNQSSASSSSATTATATAASTTTEGRQQEKTNDQSSSLDESMATLSLGARKTTWASIASQPAKVSQPKSLKSKITGSNSVLSSTNKHLTTSVTMDSSSLDSKNGINPTIKSSVSTAATSMSRSTAPQPISKVASATVASLKLDILGDEGTDSKISWPAVNASINLSLDDTPPQKSTTTINDTQPTSSNNGASDRLKIDDNLKGRDSRDHNHNQGPSSKFTNSYMQRDDRGRQDDVGRRDARDYRTRRDSDRKVEEVDKRAPVDHHDDLRDHLNARRDFKQPNRTIPVHPRQQQDESSYRSRDFKRGGGGGGGSGGQASDRNNHRGNDDFRYQPQGRNYENHRDMPQQHHLNQMSHNNNRQQNDIVPHHHYNNLRDGNHSRNHQPIGKPDLTVNPHLNPKNFNPTNFVCETENARYFIIKSYSEDDIHRSIKYSVWCSTQHGNKRLDEAYRQQQARNGKLFLFFSVNSSGHFCGIAQMTSTVDFESSSGIWAQSKWQGEFKVKWIYVKDVPNNALRHITLENNENKPVTNSRDTQEVPSEKGKAVLKIIHTYAHQTSLFDDFLHYEQRQEEERAKKSSQINHHPSHAAGPLPGGGGREHDRERINGGGAGGGRFGRPYVNSRPHNDFPNRDRTSRYA